MMILDEMFKNGISTFMVLAIAAIGGALALYMLIYAAYFIYHLFLRFYLPKKLSEEEENIKFYLKHTYHSQHDCSNFEFVTMREIENLDLTRWKAVEYNGHTIPVPEGVMNLMSLWVAFRIAKIRPLFTKYELDFNLPSAQRLTYVLLDLRSNLALENKDLNSDESFDLDRHTMTYFEEIIPLLLSYRRHQLRLHELFHRGQLAPAL